MGFSLETGKIEVDLKEFLEDNNQIYMGKSKTENEWLPLSNGKISCAIGSYYDDKIIMQIHHVDASAHSGLSCGRLILNMPYKNDEISSQFLDLYSGNVIINYKNGATITFFSNPHTEVIGVNFKGLAEITGELITWQTELKEVYSADLIHSKALDNEGFHTLKSYKIGGSYILEKGVVDNSQFGFRLGIKSDHAIFKIKSERNISISLKGDNGTLWIGNTTVYGSTIDNLELELDSTQKLGYEEVLKRNQQYWASYFEKSFLSLDDGTAMSKNIEKLYWLWLYIFAGEGYGRQQIQFIAGALNYRKDGLRWMAGYWHFNQRCLYNSVYSANRLDLLEPYINFHLSNIKQYEKNAKIVFGFEDCIFVPEVVAFNGDRAYYDKDGDSYTTKITSTTAEVAVNMYNKYKYSLDKEYLKKVYPFIIRATEFFIKLLKFDGEYYRIKGTNSMENWWVVDNSVADQGGIRSLFRSVVDIVGILECGYKNLDKVKDVLEKLEPIPQNEEQILPHSTKNYITINDDNGKENVHLPELEVVFPHNVIGIDSPLRDKAIKSYENRVDPCPYTWCQDSIFTARLGLGNIAYFELKELIKKGSKYHNGVFDDDNCVLEGNGILVTALGEMFMQSYEGKIRLFPAVPNRNFKGSFTLLAQGGFLISSEYEDGKIKYIGVKSQLGGEIKIVNPWGSSVSINNKTFEVKKGFIVFHTKKDEIYLIKSMNEDIWGITNM